MGIVVRPPNNENKYSDNEDTPETNEFAEPSTSSSSVYNYYSNLPITYNVGLLLDIKDSSGIWSEAGMIFYLL